MATLIDQAGTSQEVRIGPALWLEGVPQSVVLHAIQ